MPSPPTTILLCRHGETEANVAGVLQGQSESNLTGKGIAQARALGAALAERVAAAGSSLALAPAIFSSDLLRTVDTSKAIIEAFAACGRALELRTDVRLRERRLGPFQGRTVQQCQAELPTTWAHFSSEDENGDNRLDERQAARAEAEGASENGGVEPYVELRSRAGSALREIAAAHPGQSIIVVSHGGFVHSACLELTGLVAIPHIGNVSLTTLVTDDAASPSAQRWRATSVGEQLVRAEGLAASQAHNVDVKANA